MTNTSSPLTIRYEDDELVAASKPSGLLVHRTELAPDRVVLLQLLRRQVGCRLYPIHRLDRGASGLVLFGKSPAAARWLQAALAAPTARKDYSVLLRGQVTEPFVCDRPLRSARGEPTPSRTEVEPLEVFERSTLANVRILTGRRHQIRRHMNHAGHHVVGDTTHGKGHVNRAFRADYGLERLFLHARSVELAHATTEQRLQIVDPLPEELERVLEQLRVGN